jgi:kelch-like protein 24/35
MTSSWEFGKDLLKVAQRGDLIEFNRGMYQHWGVYVGDGHIVHVPAESKNDKYAVIARAKLTSVANSDKCRVANCYDKYEPDRHSGDESASRAEARLGERWKYDFLGHNCEHFACWCRYGFEYSDQVSNDHELPTHRQHRQGKTGKKCPDCGEMNKGEEDSCVIA